MSGGHVVVDGIRRYTCPKNWSPSAVMITRTDSRAGALYATVEKIRQNGFLKQNRTQCGTRKRIAGAQWKRRATAKKAAK
jgi:hypothetical protein